MGARRYYGVGVLLGAFVLGLLGFRYYVLSHQETLLQGTILNQERAMPAYHLTDMDGKPFTEQQLKGQWTWIFFGFMSCPQLCPTTLTTLSRMYQTLEAKHMDILPRVMLISLDPERDTLQKLGPYVKAFNPHFYAATGREADVQWLAQQLGVAFERINLQGKAYTLEHSGVIMVVDPQGQLRAFLTPPYTPDALVHDHLLLIRNLS